MNESNWPEPAPEDTPPELLHEVRALLAEFEQLDSSADGYSHAVTALRVARDAVAAAVAASDPAFIAAQREGTNAATEDHPFGIAWRLAVLGLRRGEILALSWDGIDFDAGTLAVTAARLATAGAATTGAPKTKSSVRTLPMPDDLTYALRRVRKRQQEQKLALGSKWKDSEYVVVDEFGAAPYPDTLTAAWRKALAGAGLPHVRLHDARHSCATLMHLNGVPTVVIAAWLGHQDPGFTLRTYAHSTNDALADAAATLATITAGKKKDAR